MDVAGLLVLNMASRGYEAYGCDRSSEMLRYAQKNGEILVFLADRFRVNEESGVPFQGRFDAISIRGYIHQRHDDVFTQRIREKLRHGGILVAKLHKTVSFFIPIAAFFKQIPDQ